MRPVQILPNLFQKNFKNQPSRLREGQQHRRRTTRKAAGDTSLVEGVLWCSGWLSNSGDAKGGQSLRRTATVIGAVLGIEDDAVASFSVGAGWASCGGANRPAPVERLERRAGLKLLP